MSLAFIPRRKFGSNLLVRTQQVKKSSSQHPSNLLSLLKQFLAKTISVSICDNYN